MTAIEETLFSDKLKKQDVNHGANLPSPNAASRGDRRSLKNVVAMLNRQQNLPNQLNQSNLKAQLKDQCKESKQEERTCKLFPPDATMSSADKENETIEIPASQIVNLSAHTGALGLGTNNSIAFDAPIKIPGRGEFHVVDKIVTMQGDKKKITLRLGGRTSKDSPCSPKDSPPASPSTRSTVVGGSIVTDGESLQSLTNMARTNVGLDEILRNECDKVRALCGDLPQNPLQWTRSHVVKFVENTNCKQYSILFQNEEVDGHAFLLLTANELHKMLAIPLGPAMKLHDYIFTLQQLVNNAPLQNREESDSKDGGDMASRFPAKEGLPGPRFSPRSAAGTAIEIELLLEVDVESGSCFLVPNAVVRSNVSGDYSRATCSPAKRKPRFDLCGEESVPHLKLPKLSDATLPDVKQEPAWTGDESKPFVPVDLNQRPVVSKRRHAIDGFKDDKLPEKNNVCRRESPTLESKPVLEGSACWLPAVREGDVRDLSLSGSAPGYIRHVPIHVPVVGKTIIHEPKHVRRTDGPMLRPASALSQTSAFPDGHDRRLDVERATSSQGSAGRHARQSDDMCLAPAPITTSHPIYGKISDVKLKLGGKDLWSEFSQIGTEMILTRIGRRMFPTIDVRVTGMDPNSKYVLILDFVPVDNFRYKYEYDSSSWLIACEEYTPAPNRMYVHPESPALGSLWMKNSVDFNKCKLTNNAADRSGYVLMHSMHKYQPRLHVVYWDGSLPLSISPFELLRIGFRREFVFKETQFVAVTAYQNSQITQLKIATNPFARGFRGDWRRSQKQSGNDRSSCRTEKLVSGRSRRRSCDEEDEGESELPPITMPSLPEETVLLRDASYGCLRKEKRDNFRCVVQGRSNGVTVSDTKLCLSKSNVYVE